MSNERRYFHINTASITDEQSAYASVTVDLQHENPAAAMTMTLPEVMGGDNQSTVEISLTHCELVVGGNGPSHK